MAKIVFVQEELRDRFGIMYLSAFLKRAGHEREIFIAQADADFKQAVIDSKPDVISFSTMTPGIAFALKWAEIFKHETSALILMGGPHPTFYPEVIENKCLDIICRGDGEIALPKLLDAINAGEDYYHIDNFWVKDRNDPSVIYKNDLCERMSIDEWPLPDWDLYFDKYEALRNAPTKKIMVAKGCPFDCSYCFNKTVKQLYTGKGKYLSFKNVDNVIEEIKAIRDRYGMKWLQIITDTVNVNRKWFIEFLTRYKQTFDIPFVCNVRIDHIDEEMVALMKEARCDRVNYGVEHGNYGVRRDILHRDIPDDVIIRAGELFTKYGIRVQTANIIGLPGETVELAMETVRLNRRLKPSIAQCFILQPYPRTEIYKYSVEHGFLDEGMFNSAGTGFQVDFEGQSDSMPLKLEQEKELIKLFYLFDFMVKYPFLDRFLKLILGLPCNRLYKFIYVYPVLRQNIKYSGTLKDKLKGIMRLIKVFFRG
ncbi:MAG: hypothetical protein A2017_10855 [Lentisphaerae bacterium GWF2_44_16]|nr:MAG: hypothetical protein A2017_10855 [Lentisphaerae bacterium GWF2_44_16]